MPRLRRFLVTNLPCSGRVPLNARDSHHLRHVLRLKIGDACLLADAQGNEAEAEVSSFLPDGTAEIMLTGGPEKKYEYDKIIVAQALPQRGIMDIIVQKAGELGVRELVPMITERTQIHPKGDGLKRVMNRWQRIAHEAAKQSENRAVCVGDVTTFEAVLDRRGKYSAIFLAHPREQSITARELEKKICTHDSREPILILIGPEGGFSESELDHARHRGADIFSLPGGILKTDTAFVGLVGIFRFILANR